MPPLLTPVTHPRRWNTTFRHRKSSLPGDRFGHYIFFSQRAVVWSFLRKDLRWFSSKKPQKFSQWPQTCILLALGLASWGRADRRREDFGWEWRSKWNHWRSDSRDEIQNRRHWLQEGRRRGATSEAGLYLAQFFNQWKKIRCIFFYQIVTTVMWALSHIHCLLVQS